MDLNSYVAQVEIIAENKDEAFDELERLAKLSGYSIEVLAVMGTFGSKIE